MLVQRPAEQAFRIARAIDGGTVVRLVLTLSCAAALSGIAEAAAYPARPMRFIVPFAPGGNGDIMGRLLGQRLTENLGQQVVVDNRAGASNIIGTELAAKAAPDGHTILLISTAHFANPSLVKQLPYDTLRDFAPVTLVGSTPLVLVTYPGLPVTTLKDLIALAKAKPGALNYGTSGTGASGHLAGALLGYMAGIDFVHVPYRGTAQATTDVLAGRVQLAFPSMTSVLPYVKTGKLKALGMTGAKRSPLAPDVPTISEAGVAGYQASIWNGVLAPAGTPRTIIGRLNTEIVRVLGSPEARERFSSIGTEVAHSTPEEFGAFIRSEIQKWAAVLRGAGIKAE